jgi:hypothetical protein
MPRINTPSSGHVGPVGTPVAFLPYTNAENRYLTVLRAAMDIIGSRIKGHASCNAAFQALPGGRSFADVWNDNAIWINYDPDSTPGYYGAAVMNGNDITISKYAFLMGHWTVVSTLIHEFAHINGAGGHDSSAEDTLKKCLLKDLHNPHIIGRLLNPPNNKRVA